MSIPTNFAHTIADFWLLGPRRFFDALQTKPNRYLTPRDTFAITLVLSAPIYFAQYALIYFAPAALNRSLASDQVQVFALSQGQSITVSLVLTIVNVLLFPLAVLVVASIETLFSRLWPVGSKGKFRPIWDFNLYYYSACVWIGVLGLLVAFAIGQMGTFNAAAIWVGACVTLLAFWVAYFGYKVPGLAVINGASYGRMLGNQLLWFFVSLLAFWVAMFVLLFISVMFIMMLGLPVTPTGVKV